MTKENSTHPLNPHPQGRGKILVNPHLQGRGKFLDLFGLLRQSCELPRNDSVADSHLIHRLLCHESSLFDKSLDSHNDDSFFDSSLRIE